MAKVAFFMERLPSSDDDISLFSAALIHSLADQHHDIRVYTTNDNSEWHSPHSRIEIVRPFRKWNWWETAKLIPLLAIDSPEIIHVIQPRHQSVMGLGPSALNFLAALTSFPTRPRLVLSIYELDKRALNKISPLLHSANLILVRTSLQKTELIENWKVVKEKIQILPALSLPTLNERDNESLPDGLSSVSETGQLFVYVPGGLDQHQDLDLLFKVLQKLTEADERLSFVLQGSWSDLQISKRSDWQKKFKENPAASRTLFTGRISSSTEDHLFNSATILLLATLDPHKLKFWKHSRRALQSGGPIVLSRIQVQVDELDWLEAGSALFGKDTSEIVNACLQFINDESLRLRLRDQAYELADRQVTDRPANYLTRLYQELLSQR